MDCLAERRLRGPRTARERGAENKENCCMDLARIPYDSASSKEFRSNRKIIQESRNAFQMLVTCFLRASKLRECGTNSFQWSKVWEDMRTLPNPSLSRLIFCIIFILNFLCYSLSDFGLPLFPTFLFFVHFICLIWHVQYVLTVSTFFFKYHHLKKGRISVSVEWNWMRAAANHWLLIITYSESSIQTLQEIIPSNENPKFGNKKSYMNRTV